MPLDTGTSLGLEIDPPAIRSVYPAGVKEYLLARCGFQAQYPQVFPVKSDDLQFAG